MAGKDRIIPREKKYHRVVRVMGRNSTQDFFTQVLKTLVKIGLKNNDGMAPPNLLMKSLARVTHKSVNDKGLRTRVGRALQRGMENGFLTLKCGQIKLTRRAGVVADSKGKLWLKIPALLPAGKCMQKKNANKLIPKDRKARPKPGRKLETVFKRRVMDEPLQRKHQQQQNRQIQTNLCLSRSTGHGSTSCRSARPIRISKPCQTHTRYRTGKSGHNRIHNPTKGTSKHVRKGTTNNTTTSAVTTYCNSDYCTNIHFKK